MDELFDAHFTVGFKRLTYRLDQEQAGTLYQEIGQFISTGLGSEGVDVTFREFDHGGRELAQTFRLDTTDAFTLYRRLGTYLQKRYPGSEPRLQVHAVGT